MVAKCANPECSSPFTYFRDGRLFLVDRRIQNDDSLWPTSKCEHYWLCGDCAALMEVVLYQNAVVLRRRDLARAAAA